MAYSDYQNPNPQGQRQEPWRMPGGTGGNTFSGGSVLPVMGGAMPTQPAPQGGSAPLPTNTRQQALQSVQQAYAGRMPGQMDALNGVLGQLGQPVGLKDPGLAPALQAGANADQRSFERQRAALAEVMGANGLGDSGAMNTKLLGIGQRIGESGAARDASLVYDEMGSRRNALLSALGMDQNRYEFDNSLAMQLAALEAQLNQQALSPFFGAY